MSDTDRLLPPLVLAGGLLSSLLLFGVLYSLASSRSRAVEIANEITKDLRASTEQLQALSRRLVDIQETDRRQFSRELHDRIGQNLTALSINLDILKTQLSDDENAEFRSRLDDSAALLESTAGAVENVMSELRPPMLDDYGLLPALQWYGNQFSSRTGIRVEVHGEERAERLPPATEIALFRIAQEALNNIAKHAHAGFVDVRLERSGDQFVMSVADDGTGFDAASNSNSGRRVGLGMVTMRERTQAVGGQFEVGAAPGRGTRVMVRILS
jgi:two-component system sensor histidine kinase UhpB